MAGGELGELYERFYKVYSSTSPRYVSPGKARERSRSEYQRANHPPQGGNVYDYEQRFQEMQQRHASYAEQALRMRPPPGRQPRGYHPQPQPQQHRHRSPFHGFEDQHQNDYRHQRDHRPPQNMPHPHPQPQSSYNRSRTTATVRPQSPTMRGRSYNNQQEPDWIPRNQPSGMQVRPDWAQSRKQPQRDASLPRNQFRHPSVGPEPRQDERMQRSSEWSRDVSPYGRSRTPHGARAPSPAQRSGPLSRQSLFPNDDFRQNYPDQRQQPDYRPDQRQQPDYRQHNYPEQNSWFPKTAELPEIVSYEDGAVDITALIKQRQHLDDLISKFEKQGRREEDFEGDSREAKWRRSREAQIERLRRENFEREELIDMERRRLDELRERTQQQRINTTNKELEYRRQRLAVEERSAAMRRDYKAERRRQLERETDYLSMNLPVDSSLEGRRRDAEYDALDIQMQAGSAKKQAALLLEDELLMRDVEAQQLDRVREQQQRDVLAWQRDGHRERRNISDSSKRTEMLMALQERHYDALVHLGTRPERQRIAAAELDSRIDIAVAEMVSSDSLSIEAITVITTQEADSRATINLQQSSESNAIHSFLIQTIQILSSESSDIQTFWQSFVHERAVAEELTRASQEAHILRLQEQELEAAKAAEERKKAEEQRKLEEQKKLEEEKLKLEKAKLEEEKAAEEKQKLEAQKQEEEKEAAAKEEQQKKEEVERKAEEEKKEAEKAQETESKSKTPAKPQPSPPPPPPANKPPAPPKPAEKPAAKPAEKPAAKPAEKPAAKPAEKPAAKPAEKPAAKPSAADGNNRRHTFRVVDDWTEFYDQDKPEQIYYRNVAKNSLTQNIYETKFYDKTKELEKLVKLGAFEKKGDNIIDPATKKAVPNVDDAVQKFATDIVKEMARQLQSGRWLIGETAEKEVTITECVDGKKVKNGKKWAKNFYSMVREELAKAKKGSKSESSPKAKPAAKKYSDSEFEALAEKMIAAKKWKLWEKKNGTKCYRDMSMESKEWIKAAEFRKLLDKGEVKVK
eukprot:TRINITY_DN2986_c0_g1_i1.p1 TRINITY_DN2986_c0_g1~~TRINITY_DN2986_c0_g1_i1.p1  ORF type:complete len:1029 (+),score=270.93 TRINITY_DN2986_c0_g1_i1:39-3125(+)